jgi:hypothetical protein
MLIGLNGNGLVPKPNSRGPILEKKTIEVGGNGASCLPTQMLSQVETLCGERQIPHGGDGTVGHARSTGGGPTSTRK